VAKGDRIAVLGRNGVDFARLFFGAARAGAVLVTLSARNSAVETHAIVEQTRARLLFHDDALDASVAAAIPAVRFGEEFERFAQTGDPDGVPRTVMPDDPLCMTFTGGTTGMPRGVLVTHRSRCCVAAGVAAAFGFNGCDIVCVCTPMAHVAGLLVCFVPAVAVGASCVLQPRWDAGMFFDLVEQHGVTASLMVPTQLYDILAHDGFAARRLASVQRIVYAGAPMPAALLARLMDQLPWIEFIENYGQSELGALTVRRGADLPAKAGSIGRAIDGIDIAVLGEDGGVVADGQPGELCCRGVNLLLGYDRDPAATAALRKYGPDWLATGDAAIRDADGFYTLIDRIRDIVISGGENIYPSEIEAVLRAHPAVADCAVFGVPDARLGEVPVAHVIVAKDGAADVAELIAHCAAGPARHKTPRSVQIVTSLPRTAIGKVQKNRLRDEYPNGLTRKPEKGVKVP
jgi:acyl-CoA synthetase (AMP-forming)/AMP-acid ligase II